MSADASRIVKRARIAAIVALVVAVVPAALVYLGLEPVPTMLVPVLIAALPLLGRTPSAIRTLSLVGVSLMGIGVLMAILSVGYLFVPSLIALLITALLAREPVPPAGSR